ncbi:MAG: EamA family transporter [Arenicella sp.]
MKTIDILIVLFVVIVWGVSFSAIKIGLEELPPILFSALRFAIVAFPAIVFVPFPRHLAWQVLGVGFFLGVVKFSLLFIGMKAGTSAGLASLLLQAQVFFTIVLSIFLFKETINRLQLVGIIIAASGFTLFFINTNIAVGSSNVTVTGLILILMAALAWAISNLIMKKALDIDLLKFMVWASAIPPIPLIILSYLFETNNPLQLVSQISPKSWGAIAYVGFISTLLAFALWGKLLSSYSAATVTPFALLIPVAGMLTSYLVFNESLNSIEVIGCLLVMLGLLCSVLHKTIQRS